MGIMRTRRKVRKIMRFATVAAVCVILFRGLSISAQKAVVNTAVDRLVQLSILRNSGIELDKDDLMKKADFVVDSINGEDMDRIIGIASELVMDGRIKKVERCIDNWKGLRGDDGVLEWNESETINSILEKYIKSE